MANEGTTVIRGIDLMKRRTNITSRTEAISRFLHQVTHSDLASMYNYEMECQVNVAQDGGERIEGEYKGRQWHGWTDNIQVWKSFRIPLNANSDPIPNDVEMKFDLLEHAEGIGMTGWNWHNKVSKWVAFDFDAILGHSDKHSKKLTYKELEEVEEQAKSIPWVTIRKSTSGKGLHIYVFLDDVATNNHTEHAALARSILGLMSAYTGFSFQSRVDICGGNMWVWHRKMKGTDGLTLLKQGDILKDVPINWKDHLNVITGTRKRVLPNFIKDEREITFEDLVSQQTQVPLDEEHRKLINFLDESGASFWWDQDHYMLVAHTWDLEQAHEQLRLRGIFKTMAQGREHGMDHNCFMFPLRRGAWAVRRYTPGVTEDQSWEQDGSGWTRCYLNKEPDLGIAAKANQGIEDEGGKFIFRYAEQAQKAALALGADLNLPNFLLGRQTVIKKHKDGKRLVVEIDHQNMDRQDEMVGWLQVRGPKWRKIFNTNLTAPTNTEVGNYDDVIRHLVSESGSDRGWVIKTNDKWHEEPLKHASAALESMGLKYAEAKTIIGTSIFKPWVLVNRPFQPEYPGDRQWNRNAPQLRFVPSLTKEGLLYDTWLKILNHIGKDLTQSLQENQWAKNNGLRNGADYLKCWIASLFQQPTEPLPYLFLYGPQDSGKSILHEALNLLITSGYCRADSALISSSGFNAELEDAVLCVIEETDLRKNTQAYNRIKDWVTSRQLPIHRKLFTPYHVTNTTHWVQCSNDRSACPVFSGDTRITMIHVGELENKEGKRDFLLKLEKEAPDFLAAILKLEIPKSNDRLGIPVIETSSKIGASRDNKNLLELYIDEHCYYVPGVMTTIAEFYDKFTAWLDPNDRYDWSKVKVGRAMPDRFPKGRNPKNAQWCFGNISFDDIKSKDKPLVLRSDKLVEEIQSEGAD